MKNIVDELLEAEIANTWLDQDNQRLRLGENLAQVMILDLEMEKKAILASVGTIEGERKYQTARANRFETALLEEQRHNEALKARRDELERANHRLMDSLKVLDARCTDLEQALLAKEASA